MIYFAFGSNLDARHLRRRCPSARPLGLATVADRRLAFAGWSGGWGGGVATLIEETGAVTVGRLYRLAQEDLDTLDRIEGHPTRYLRQPIEARLDGDGSQVAAETYLKALRSGGGDAALAAPTILYLRVIASAYRELGLDPAPLLRAIEETGSPTLSLERIERGPKHDPHLEHDPHMGG